MMVSNCIDGQRGRACKDKNRRVDVQNYSLQIAFSVVLFTFAAESFNALKMAKVRITKEFHFEMAHQLDGYDGLCRNVHGHSYKLSVTVMGEPECDASSPKYGMVMDFSVLKRIVNEEVVDRLDHAILMRETSPNVVSMRSITERIVCVKYQPTCENMVVDFAERISRRLPEGVDLLSVKLNETATSYAEWFASDNE